MSERGKTSERFSSPTLAYTHPENFVVSELLKSSREFQAFYEAERNKITRDVYWAHDQTLPEGIDYRVTRLFSSSGKQIAQVIRLRQVPATVKDACKIAHELEHLVLDTEGFQLTHPLVPHIHPSFRAHEVLSSSLNSMLTDPLVDSRLQGYGFDLRVEYEREVEEGIRQLSRFTRPPSDRLERTRWMFNYVDKLLYWEMLDSSREQSEFQLWFDSRFPYIASRGKKLLARILVLMDSVVIKGTVSPGHSGDDVVS